jgi:hypothetical protein
MIFFFFLILVGQSSISLDDKLMICHMTDVDN